MFFLRISFKDWLYFIKEYTQYPFPPNMHKLLKSTFLLLFVLTGCKSLATLPPSYTALSIPNSLTCQVLYVHDGDTFKAICGKETISVRVACLDAPEKNQEGGLTSTQFTRSLIQEAGNVVTLVPLSKDRYGRVVGEVYVGTTLLQEALLSSGNARIYEQYSHCSHIQLMRNAEALAKSGKLGIWGYNSVAPWDYRHKK